MQPIHGDHFLQLETTGKTCCLEILCNSEHQKVFGRTPKKWIHCWLIMSFR